MDATILTAQFDDGSYSDRPDFSTQIWPVLEANLHKTEIRMLFREPVDRISQKFFCQQTQLGAGIWEINPAKFSGVRSSRWFSPNEMDWFGGTVLYGHFKVLFKCSEEEAFVQTLKSLWPIKKDKPVDAYFSEAELHMCFPKVKNGDAIFGFGHDGDPMVLVYPHRAPRKQRNG